jgi:hypothetical protein
VFLVLICRKERCEIQKRKGFSEVAQEEETRWNGDEKETKKGK